VVSLQSTFALVEHIHDMYSVCHFLRKSLRLMDIITDSSLVCDRERHKADIQIIFALSDAFIRLIRLILFEYLLFQYFIIFSSRYFIVIYRLFECPFVPDIVKVNYFNTIIVF
jgi:hypothetical protein